MSTLICPKEQCTGCAACFNICPKECISMVLDTEGFLHPVIDPECCDDCGLCKRICPILHSPETSHSSTPSIMLVGTRMRRFVFRAHPMAPRA